MTGQDAEQTFAESDLLIVRIAGECMEIGELVGLFGNCVGDLAAAVSHVHTEQRGHRVNVGIALDVG